MSLVVGMLLSAMTSAEVPTLKLATGDDYAPYTDRKLPHGGFFTRLIERAFEESGGFDTRIVWVPWNRALEQTKTVQFDGTFPWGDKAERRQKLEYSEELYESILNIWVNRQSDFRPVVMEDLKGKSYCNPIGYGLFGLTKELVEEGLLHVETPETMATCLKMLAADRVDFVTVDSIEAASALQEAEINEDRILKTPLINYRLGLYFLVGKDHPEAGRLIEAVNEGYHRLKASGELDDLKHQYGLTPALGQ